MKITIQYFDGCPHWQIAERRVLNVLEGLPSDRFTLERQLIESPAMAQRVGFHGSPTILIDGRDPFATGAQPAGVGCRVFLTEDGVQGAPSEALLRDVIKPALSDPPAAHRANHDDQRTRVDGRRVIGRMGSAARVVVGLAFLYLGIVGLPPVHLLPWWQVVLGLVGAPLLVASLQVARLQFTTERLEQTGVVAVVINFIVFLALVTFEPTRGATLVFLGSAMLFAAARGASGCEVVAVSNWLLRRDDQLGCPLFWPVDAYEASTRPG
ncbi:MAG TPA: DUF2892 domain-containing protein [Candidatus Dormibacteraeota bacterium]|nr:DUF2892 domain-containing protein [Candidatus Dormibacteraeota bacterium]